MIRFKLISAETMGVTFREFPSIDFPPMRVQRVSVPGRDGDLTISEEGADPIDIHLKATAIGRKREELYNWLSGSGTLRFHEKPEYYMLAEISERVIIRQILPEDEVLELAVVFHCQPYWRLISGDVEQTFTSFPFQVNNPGNLPAYPIMKIYGSGGVELKVDGSTYLTFTNIDDYLIVHSEMDLIYKGTSSRESISIGKVPILSPGDHTITLTGNVTKVEFRGRWRTR